MGDIQKVKRKSDFAGVDTVRCTILRLSRASQSLILRPAGREDCVFVCDANRPLRIDCRAAYSKKAVAFHRRLSPPARSML